MPAPLICRLFGAYRLSRPSAAILAMMARAQPGTKVAMLLPGSINDQSWNAQWHAALAAMKVACTERLSRKTSGRLSKWRRCATMRGVTSAPSSDIPGAQMDYLMGVLAARMSKTGKVASVNELKGLPNIVAQVGGVVAAPTGLTDLFISGGAEHQGLDGGGPVAVIAEMK